MGMTNEECFAVWAPELDAWSRWAKPALFSGAPAGASGIPASGPGAAGPATAGEPKRLVGAATTAAPATPTGQLDVSWVQDPRARTALIVDLPGVESVRAGLELARRGYRPVPLFNTSVGPSSVIDAASVAGALLAGAEELRKTTVPPGAPPAFLIDSERARALVKPEPGRYDNRWVVFPQDFPSANYLQAAGIGEVLLVQREPVPPADDLAHVLLRWQQGGVQILATDAKTRDRPRSLTISPPSRFRRAWYRATALMGFRRNDAGGFGAMIPLITTSTGYS